MNKKGFVMPWWIILLIVLALIYLVGNNIETNKICYKYEMPDGTICLEKDGFWGRAEEFKNCANNKTYISNEYQQIEVECSIPQDWEQSTNTRTIN